MACDFTLDLISSIRDFIMCNIDASAVSSFPLFLARKNACDGGSRCPEEADAAADNNAAVWIFGSRRAGRSRCELNAEPSGSDESRDKPPSRSDSYRGYAERRCNAAGGRTYQRRASCTSSSSHSGFATCIHWPVRLVALFQDT